MLEEGFKNQVQLLLSVLPEIAKIEQLALHGGTAINLFERDMPRLSVDIDLTYLPIQDWETTNTEIEKIGSQLTKEIPSILKGVIVERVSKYPRIDISNSSAKIKVEIPQVIRGAIGDTRNMILCDAAQDQFDAFCEMRIVPKGQLYGGKICAALDRQHPRDLFDIAHLLQNEGLSPAIIRGFIFGLCSHSRPLVEMVKPNLKNQQDAFEKRFVGMTNTDFSYDDFEQTRLNLVTSIHENLTQIDRDFLISFDLGEPDWTIHDFSKFPSVQRKLEHLQRFKRAKPDLHSEQHERLIAALHG